MHEDIGDLEVPMYDILLGKIVQALKDISDDGFSLVLVKISLLPQPRLQIPFVAQLGDDVTVPIAGENLMTFEDVGVAEFFKHVDLREEEFLKFFAFE